MPDHKHLDSCCPATWLVCGTQVVGEGAREIDRQLDTESWLEEVKDCSQNIRTRLSSQLWLAGRFHQGERVRGSQSSTMSTRGIQSA